MGNSIYRMGTRTGDQGETSLGCGTRVDKDSPPIETLGAIDELNGWIGVLVELSRSQEVKEVFTLVQHDLFDLAAQVRVPGSPLLSQQHLLRLEGGFERIDAEFPKVQEFILPGGTLSAAFAHVARTVCRRAERRLFSLCELERAAGAQLASAGEAASAASFGLSYLNRLSDLLLLAARLENRACDRSDVLWERGKSLSSKSAT